MPGPAAPPLGPDSPIADAAQELLERLDSLFLEQRKGKAKIAHALAEAKRIDLHKACGYSSLHALAWDRYQLGRTTTSELIAISIASEELPKIRAAFDAGILHWTKAREICKVATPEDELKWLSLALTSTVAQLRAARKGEPLKAQRVLSLTPEQAARFDQALAGVKDGLDLAQNGEAVLALLEGAGGVGKERLGESAIPRIVITLCGTCRLATRDSREGPLVVEPAVVEAAFCSGEVHDLREEENVVTRAIPAKVRRRVLDRDQRRCQVPRCQNRSFLEVHHEDGWQAGHEPSRMLVLCEAHHRQRHEGWLRIEGEAPEFRFRTRSGALLSEDHSLGGEEFAHANSEAGPGRGAGGVAHPNSEAGPGRGAGGVAHANSEAGPGRGAGGVAHANAQAGPGRGAGGVAHANSGTGAGRGAGWFAHANSGTDAQRGAGGFTPANSRTGPGRGAGGFTHANSQAGPEGWGSGLEPALEQAELALGRLGLDARERRRRLRGVLARQGQRGWSAAELVRAVLLAA